MGWLFNKKKTIPKVPFPEGRPFDEKSLQFPQSAPSERTIRPEQVQAAVGLGQPINLPEDVNESPETMEPSMEEQQVQQISRPTTPRTQTKTPNAAPVNNTCFQNPYFSTALRLST